MRSSSLLLATLLVTGAFGQVAGQQSGPTPDPSAQPATKKARVEGKVSNLNGESLKKALVRLQGFGTVVSGAAGTMPTMPTSYTTESDAQGNFLFEEIEPGRYSLSAERPGYVRSNYGARGPNSGGTPIVLAPGQSMTGLQFKMTPHAVISGKITDEDGDPVLRAQLMVYQYRWNNGKRTLGAFNSAQSNPDGTFQITGLPAGKYFLGAQDMQAMMITGLNERPGKKGPEDSYVMTYYPDTTDLSRAVGVDVPAGGDVRGIEIRMQKARVYRIRGKLVAPAGASTANTALQLMPSGSTDFLAMAVSRNMSMVRPDGSFDMQRVLPGSYIIRSQNVRINNDSGPNTPMFIRQMVTVSDSNIEDLQVVLQPGATVTGKITIEGQDRQQAQQNQSAANQAKGNAKPTARPNINLNPTMPLGAGANTRSKDDGTFELQNVPPDIFNVNINGIPDGTYVKAIRFGGQDALHSPVDLTSGGGGQFDIVLSPTAADVAGVARNSNGEPAVNVNVALWPKPGSNTSATFQFRGAQTDKDGSFRMTNLPPGEYFAAAFDLLSDTGVLQSPDFRAKFESKAAAIKLSDSGHGTADLTVIPQDASDAEIAKLP
jgi:Carboxypeptidase regulatory-like domain